MIVAKTTLGRFSGLEAEVLSLHGYAVPEIVCTPVVAGHAPYLDWVRAEIIEQ